jgi:hypothetical protein
VLLDYGYNERKAERPADCVVPTVTEAATWIIQRTHRREGGGV